MSTTGRVLFYDQGKAFGFIVPDNGGENIFFHCSGFADGVTGVRAGEKVKYCDSRNNRDGRRVARYVEPTCSTSLHSLRRAVEEDFRDVPDASELLRELRHLLNDLSSLKAPVT